MAASVQGTILEQRQELMVSPTGGIPTWRKAHFIKPTVSSIDGPPIKLPSPPPMPISPPKVVFNGRMDPIEKWETWVDKMESKYHSVWKKAGIYYAIEASTYIIHDDCDLIFGLAERWCSETNTFIFPWGEATVTLEDLLILGGFPVLGSPVPFESPELVDTENLFISLNSNNHSQWSTMFMDKGTESEHVVFLSLWLSMFVFPGNKLDHIGNHVFRIAIYLARGTRLALAPAVLASIYRDMGLLKASMADSSQIEDDCLSFVLRSPLYYVQVWAWERLPPLHPKPNFVKSGEPRLARWKGLKKLDTGNVRPAINYAGETFLWRPYALAVDNWSIPKLYKEKEDWVVGNDLDSELESLARCLRPSKLVWIDCQEPYNPHRVAMQFGLDQDLPGWISWDNTSRDTARYSFTKPLSYDNWLFLPSRLSESDVTTRYLEWWRKKVLCPVDDFQNVVKRQRSSRVPRYYPDKLKQMKTGNSSMARLQTCSKFQCNEGSSHRQMKYYPAALFQSASTMTGGVGLSSKMKLIIKQEEDTEQQNSSTYPDVPPGFLPKSVEGKGKSLLPSRKHEEISIHIAGARITRSMARSKTNTDKSQQSKLIMDHHPDVPPGFPPKSKGIGIRCNEKRSSCNAEPHKMHPGIKLGGHNVQCRLSKGKSVMVEEQDHGTTSGENISIQEGDTMTKSESTRILELEARIRMLESELASLKK